ncbi:phosphonate ABC transporter, permease protein PhnE [Aquiluna borgnonia]|uniref:Phosphonate ABC transporter, permease protein PhnE n=1 Tax=Aquiluna borgnonia TaxID=2499157 RepID=A0A7D4UI63_9MICO|nr:phosphonate ABC transporter, permease protein PhnE [Aquiluna borgnonia]QKJ25120.1 phosphonate ABC transporter, permease protein PhnE [Aquiluna borgnonia]
MNLVRGGTQKLTPKLNKPTLVTRSTVSGFLLVAIWGWIFVDMDLVSVFAGLDDINNLVDYMLPPSFADWERALELTLETFWIAVLGTFIALVLSVPLAFMAARNTTPHPAVYAVARGIIVFTRAVPDLVFALIFVRALGIGVLPGILALAFHSIGMVGKLLADAIEQADPAPREAVDSVGATKFQSIITTIVPQIIPAFISVALFRLDINLRSSTVLGLVGAGGVGLLLKERLGRLDYSEALGVVAIIFVFILAMELLAAAVRSVLLRQESSGGNKTQIAEPKKTNPKILPPWTRRRVISTGYGYFFIGLIIAGFIAVQVDFLELLGSFGGIFAFTLRMFPPDFVSAWPQIVQGMTETLAIAAVSTVLGSLLSIPLGFLAAANVTVNKFVYSITRVVLVVIRGIPELILAIVFVAATGLGPVAGIFALSIGTAGFLAKLIADSIEEISELPREAVSATGASRLQELFVSVIPQVMPSLIGQLLYTFDINIRSSAILGIVGGGGIGFLLFNSMKVLRFDTTGAIILAIFIVVYLIEILAGYVRKQVI